jgi:hypothetical protein
VKRHGCGYVTLERFVDRSAAHDRMLEISDRFKALYASGVITGYHCCLLGNDDDFLDHDVDRDAIEAITGGTVPTIYVEVGYDAEHHSRAEHQALVDELGLRLALADPISE